MPAPLRLLLPAATVAYPLVVYAGVGRWNPLWIACALAALLFLRAWSGRDALWFAAGIGALLLGAAANLGQSWVPLKLYPVMVSAALLGVFATSLWRPPTVVERIARIAEPDLPAQAIAYTRNVTRAWCAFFVVNGSVSAATALWASERTWALYNGLISYVLMGTLFAVEWLLRQRMRARLAGGLHG